jgi:tRNA (cmo5U34)-methyltransferase
MTDIAQAQFYLDEAASTKWTPAQVTAYWDAQDGSHYGEGMERWIPEFNATHTLLVESVKPFMRPNSHILDLGAGNGRVSKLLLDKYDNCHVTLVDLPNGMLKAAPAMLAAYSGRFDMCAADIFDDSLQFESASFDYVVSVFALCHAANSEVYATLYQRIFNWLKPNGIFISYDHVLGDAAMLTAMNVAGWHIFLLGCQTNQDAKAGVVSTYQEDSPLSLRQHFQLLIHSGFAAADVLYKKDIFAIYVGVKDPVSA